MKMFRKTRRSPVSIRYERGDRGICNYLFVMCDKIGIDSLDAVNEKLEKTS